MQRKEVNLTPIILAGGSGTRLWPVSRNSHPKQFASIVGESSLFERCVKRLRSSEQFHAAQPIVITSNDFRFTVSEQLRNSGVSNGQIILEPEPKDTAAAILAATLFEYKKNEDAILVVNPSDHMISDIDAFHEVVNLSIPSAKEGKIVTFAVCPNAPKTGYGYLEIEANDAEPVRKVTSFVEKPSLEVAESMISSGKYFWNSGIFLFQAKDMILAFENHFPELLEPVKQSIANASEDLEFLRLEANAWSSCPKISIDYAIMEKINNLVAATFQHNWYDLGDWNSIWEQLPTDSTGNSTTSNTHAIDCKNTFLMAEDNSVELVGLGLENIIAVVAKDAVLVTHKEKTQDIKKVLPVLRANGVSQADLWYRDNRPWGWFESLALGDRFQVKKLCVKPDGILSLQSHFHRSEHWVIVQGTAEIQIGEEVKILTEGQSIYVPLGVQHRLRNPGKMPMVLIEVQIGSYLGEDDIVRYEDTYNRS